MQGDEPTFAHLRASIGRILSDQVEKIGKRPVEKAWRVPACPMPAEAKRPVQVDGDQSLHMETIAAFKPSHDAYRLIHRTHCSWCRPSCCLPAYQLLSIAAELLTRD